MVYEEIVVDEEFIESMNVYRRVPEGTGLIEGSSLNPSFFAEKMVGVRPYSWQVYVMELFRRAVNERAERLMIDISKMEEPEGVIRLLVDGKEFVILTSRQIGKSTMIAILSLWLTVFNKAPGTVFRNTSVIIVSASDEQAKKLLRDIKRFIALGDSTMGGYLDEDGEPYFGKSFFSDLLSDSDPNNTTTITFNPYDEEVHGQHLLRGSKHGSTIKSYPPTSKVLGETASVLWVDEAAFTDKITDTFIFDYLYPVGNSTDALRGYTSTPWTTSGFFYRMVDPDGVYKPPNVLVAMFTVEAIKLENPKQYENVMKVVRSLQADGKLDEVQRAYYCRFVKGEKSYFKPEKVTEVFLNDLEPVSSYSRECDLGVDFGGQVSSHTVITISTLTDDGEIVRLYHKSYPVQEDLTLLDDIEQLMEVFNIQRVVVDDCPAGDFLIRIMEQEKNWTVTRMNFRSEKVKKYNAFRSMVNRNQVHSYEDEALKTEMLALELATGSRQSVIQHAPGYNDDLIDSWVISSYHFLVEYGEEVSFYDWG